MGNLRLPCHSLVIIKECTVSIDAVMRLYRIAERDKNATVKNNRKAVIQNELTWHEQESSRRYGLNAFLYDPPAFDAVVHPAIEFLQGGTNELVLDMGGGEGKETLELASRGMRTINLDLSHRELCRARERVRGQSPLAQVSFVQANAEEMPFMKESFRLVYGKAILHHLDLDISAAEIKRILKANGRATFAEPLAHHPLFWLARRLTSQLRTKDEQPIRVSELERFSKQFSWQEFEVYFLTMPLAYPLRMIPNNDSAFKRAHTFLSHLDARLFRLLPRLRKYAWYGVIKVHK